MSETGLILGMFIITFGIRFVMFAIAGKITFPDWLEMALKFVPPTVLTAIIVPAVVLPKGYIDVSLHNNYLIAGIVTVIIALQTKSLLKTISLGMTFFILLRYLSM
ncbi:MAG: AzlD domain-containing protein [Psychromonas sp.]